MERDDNMQQKQEQEEHEKWLEEHEGWSECVYCGEVYNSEPIRGCCGEKHFDIITTEQTKREMNAMSDEEFYKLLSNIEQEESKQL